MAAQLGGLSRPARSVDAHHYGEVAGAAGRHMPAGLLSGMALASLAARGTTGGGGTRSGTSTDGQEDGRKPPVVVIREQPPPGNPPR